MRKLSSAIIVLVISINLFSQTSPHGDALVSNCTDCHKTSGWKVDFETITFKHSSTKFPLVGQHQSVSCKECHISLEFSKAATECYTCHNDMHQQTLGNDCGRCHTPNSWLVTNITQLHQQSRFPLIGPHVTADCKDCHTNLGTSTPSSSLLRFDQLGIECYDCHKLNYMATTAPNHVQSNYSTNCTECHNINSFSWAGAGINHSFFPLEGGHDISDCNRCHTSGSYSKIPSECVSCHQPDYTATANPNHTALNFSTDCKQCHSLNPGWKPADYKDHDATYFPIYSGNHGGEWNSCTDCHSNPNNYGEFTCISCHEHNQGDTDGGHSGVSGYSYNSTSCYACHPTGSKDGSFDHSTSAFPLTGAHTTTDCAKCHTNGYAGTSTDCASCHTTNYNQTTNPNHTTINISTDCAVCHSTNPGWNPAAFPTHNNYYVLAGAHVPIANECSTCHNGNYTNTPNTCYGCHKQNYDQSTNPSHVTAQFPTTCEECHTQSVWSPSTFNHDGQYFPINSGKHNGRWNLCSDCHTNPSNFALYTCTTSCHPQSEMNDSHNGVNGYSYISSACFACHPLGSAEGSFSHSQSGFPLTGAHTITDCASCHTNGYAGTSALCSSCHITNYNQTTNPNHSKIGISTDCALCHSTNMGWNPATFPMHNDIYVIAGAHTAIANDCATCHNGNYNNISNTCVGCHMNNYNLTTNPNHAAAQFPKTCESCHSQNVWSPSTFDHNTLYPLTGAHSTIAGNCTQCHINGYPNTPNTCVGCHQNNYNQTTNPNHTSIGISTDCAVCHNTNPGWDPAAFPTHNNYYVLAGAHTAIANECIRCHNGNYTNSPNICYGCHKQNYDQSTNPSHLAAQFPTTCEDCHAQSVWSPSTFNHDGLYFPIYSGKHNGQWNSCAECHTNSSNFAIYTCTNTCHPQLATNYSHTGVSGYNYINSSCLACHPSGTADGAFDHSQSSFPLTGAHTSVDCASCHTNGYSGTSSLCYGCHTTNYNQTTNPNHTAIGILTDCASCHTTNPGWNPATFPTHNNYYVLAGAHTLIANECANCHNGNYNNTSNTCSGCHIANYNQTTNPNHSASQFATTCESCHTQSAWTPSTFDHNNTYPLTGAHSTIASNCTQCHPSGYANTPNNCSGCHQNNYNQTTNPNHAAIGISNDCAVCHTTNPGWNPATFPTHNNFYLLAGAHTSIANECANCHNGNYNNTSNTCSGCHIANYNQTTNPNHASAQYATTCESCHTQISWTPSTFNHDNTYPLTGAHSTIASNCNQCHPSGYANTPNNCSGCHQNNYNQTTNPNHATIGISNDCAVCHKTNPGWKPATFPIHSNYYVLAGAHLPIANDCATCHNGNYTNTPNKCFGCHSTDYNQTTNPNHAASQYATTCESCHTQNAWTPSTFNHSNTYPLTGAHSAIASNCVQCHPSGYANTPKTCVGCHQNNYNQTTNPNHAATGISNDCAVCHKTNAGWKPATFPTHNNYYVLAGAHLPIANDCATCHNGNYTNTPNKCYGCHSNDYNQSTNPNHTAFQFATTCESCHTQNAWTPSTFNHNNTYPLTGAHSTIASNCVQCHPSGYANTPKTCVGCHQNNYNQTTNPNHTTIGISTDCAVCHTTNPGWNPATFPIHNNYYVLAGAHTSIANDCANCHNGNYNNTPKTCAGCHINNYNQTTNPNHGTSQFPTTCETCHSQSAWTPSTFNHNNTYPLTGAHATIADNCSQCHINGYTNTPNTCVGCHQNNYNQATNPNHAVLGISNNCSSCHTTNPGWNPARFPTHNNYYVLAGAHVSIANDCAACHNGNYTNTPNTCSGCHINNYNQTTDPNHTAAQFPTTCETCHSQSSWKPSTFNHDGLYFPIYTGKHRNAWTTCANCHTNSSNYAVFTCTSSCHTQSETNSHHQEVSGYTYNSNACYNCHPNGSSNKKIEKGFNKVNFN